MRGLAAAILFTGLVLNDALATASLATLAAGYWLLNIGCGVPVLFAAFTFQWVQVTSGFFYTLLTDRALQPTYASDYRMMMYLGLFSIFALALGIRVGYGVLARFTVDRSSDTPILNNAALWMVYAGSLAATAAVQSLAWRYPMLTQPILALTFARLAILYLLLRRLVAPQLNIVAFGGVVGLEVILGLTSYFAGFREPLVLATLAVLEVFDRRRMSHWATACALAVSASFLGLLWLGVRVEYRRDFVAVEMFEESRDMRLARLQELTEGWWKRDSHEFWWNLDLLMDRLWTVYYPALAVARVPSALPHTDGRLMTAALAHVFMPRVLFPDKPPLPSDSEMVREYSGVWVAGAEENTSIAFGYVAESYLDFGVPGMFVPMLFWGVFVGASYRALQVLIRHREVAVPVLTVVFWLCVYLFERSWAKTMGLTGTMLIYVGGVAFVLDRLLLGMALKRASVGVALRPPPPAESRKLIADS